MVRLQLTSITLGTPDPRQLAAFYARLLHGEVSANEGPGEGEPEQAGWAQVRCTSDFGRVSLNFEYEANFVRPTWPSVAGEQNPTQHLDILVDSLEGAVRWAVTCGAVLPKTNRKTTSGCCSTRMAIRSASSPDRVAPASRSPTSPSPSRNLRELKRRLRRLSSLKSSGLGVREIPRRDVEVLAFARDGRVWATPAFRR